MTVCKELTKRYEQKRKSTLDEMIAYYEKNEPRGEYVLIFEGKSLQAQAPGREVTVIPAS